MRAATPSRGTAIAKRCSAASGAATKTTPTSTPRRTYSPGDSPSRESLRTPRGTGCDARASPQERQREPPEARHERPGIPGLQAREDANPDHWVIPLFGDPLADGKRWVLEGRLISVALQALRLGTSVVLDYGLWGRDERSALRWLARSAGAACQVVYLPVDKNVQLARIAHRQETTPHQTFPMSEADVDAWREQFQVPDAAELDGGEIPAPPAGWPGWPEWAAGHWPSCTDS